jgi:hypothetical protein
MLGVPHEGRAPTAGRAEREAPGRQRCGGSRCALEAQQSDFKGSLQVREGTGGYMHGLCERGCE